MAKSRWRCDERFLALSKHVLSSRLSYNPDTGAITWLPVPEVNGRAALWNKRYSGVSAGRVHPTGYILISCVIENKRAFMFSAHRVAWMMAHGDWPDGEIDHLNHIKTDNRISNLRVCTRHENTRNCGISKRNKSGFTGVHMGQNGKWIAQLRVNYKRKILGYFSDVNEAAAAVKMARDSEKFHPNHGLERAKK